MPVLRAVPDAEKERTLVSPAWLPGYGRALRRPAGYSFVLGSPELKPT